MRSALNINERLQTALSSALFPLRQVFENLKRGLLHEVWVVLNWSQVAFVYKSFKTIWRAMQLPQRRKTAFLMLNLM
ncbi:hypothetical protein AVEN_52660-1 [Araneus ventricosus]|uniref:Uncharacterized protein n=1 Tax=Araneus ventricosus TaxID=182803 RepID=A0A4Y2RXU1_ARAVE|nr:hypothetical protein AVEN_52660-1 [Araneus ventricosus]